MRSSRASRVARGAVVASIATFTALLSHVVAGGEVPGWAGIAAPWILALMASTLLAGRTLSAFRLALSVGVSQLLFHTLFVMGAPVVAGAASMPHDHHGAMTALAPALGASGTAAAFCADPLMWAMHGVAATLTTLLLLHGERAARTLLALAREVQAWARRLARRAAPALRTARSTSVGATAPFWVVRPAARLADDRRRGPPLPIAL